jgi:hypothetical protein
MEITVYTQNSMEPPQPLPRWNHSAEEIVKLTEEAIERDRKAMDRISTVPVNECGYNTVRCDPHLKWLYFD